MGKMQVAVAMGGYSSEYDISLKSGSVVCEMLDRNEFDVYAIHILKDGWNYVNHEGTSYPVDKRDFSFNNGKESVVPDVIFNTIHGTPGEDGKMQVYWELLGIPQTSAGFYPAALTFNKRDTLSVLHRFGVKCANSVYLNKGGDILESDIIKQVGLPCFVKPNRAGSSFGISKVSDVGDLAVAIEHAFSEDDEILIETALVGTEVSVCVYGNRSNGQVLPVTEIVSENEFFDYEAKYEGKSDEITPARISEAETTLVQAEARRIFQILNLSGITRSDFILQDGIPYFIEINITPGLSKESIVPKMVRESGMTLTEFFGTLVRNALNNN